MSRREHPEPASVAAENHFQYGPEPEVATVLSNLMTQLGRRAAGYGEANRLLWRELSHAVAGGKQFRGRLVVEIYAGLGGQDHLAAAQLGAAFELLHAGFLVHDDLIDHDTVRRGLPNLAACMGEAATNAGADEDAAQHFAEASAVLTGNLTVALAHRLLADIDTPTAVRRELDELLWDTLFISVAGELGDVAAGHGLWETSVSQSLSITAQKTGFYSFVAPLRAAAVLAGAPRHVRELLDAVGYRIGKAFQLTDDLLGVFAPESITGKSALSDLREGKATALIMHARTLGVWERIRADVGRPDLDEATGAVIRRELATSEAPGWVEDQAREELATARQELMATPDLALVVDAVISVWTMVERRLDEAARYVADVANWTVSTPHRK